MICGKVLMDRNAPEGLLDTPETSYIDSKRLIERWHESTPSPLRCVAALHRRRPRNNSGAASQLLREYPSIHLHTHLSENKEEINWVNSLFPDCQKVT